MSTARRKLVVQGQELELRVRRGAHEHERHLRVTLHLRGGPERVFEFSIERSGVGMNDWRGGELQATSIEHFVEVWLTDYLQRWQLR